MSEGVKKPLSSLARYINGFAFKPHHWGKEGLPIVRIEQLNNPDGYFDFCTAPVPSDNIVDDGDLIFSWSATLKVALWQHGKAALNQHLFKVQPNPGIDKDYLYQLLDFHMEALASGSHGSTMKHIKRSELDKYCVSVPNFLVQKTLSKVLRAIDTQIAATEELIAKQERVRAGLMQDLFTRGVDEHGQLRPPREQAPHLYHQTELGWLPDAWDAARLSDLTSRIVDGVHHTPT
jgi:type I restriction enzyme S subunit